MSDRIVVSFRVRDKGGPSGGKILSQEAPVFDWEKFKKTPNAEAFVKKAYLASVTKVVREIEEQKNGSTATDLNSMESVIARALCFSRAEIQDWIKTRDWNKANQVRDIEKLLPEIEKKLPDLATRQNPFSSEVSAKLADKVIAAVADNPDPIADFLFTTLTTERDADDLIIELGNMLSSEATLSKK